MPKLVTSEKPRKNLRWDAKRKCYVGWQIDVYVNQGAGKRAKRRRVTYSSESDARSAENRLRVKSENIRLGIERSEPARRVSIVAALDSQIEKIADHYEKKRVARIAQVFLDLNPEIEFMDEIAESHFNKFIERREADGVKAATILRELTPLTRAFKKARKSFGELAGFRLPEIERPKNKSRPRQTNVTEEEKNLLVAAILSDRLKKERARRTLNRPVIAAMFELAWYLGLRLGEARKLEKTDFNFENKSLRVVRWKTGTINLFEFLPERVVEILRDASANSPTTRIFNLTCTQRTFDLTVRQACESNNLKYGIKELDGITFHSNRHSFATRLVRVTDIATAQSFTGHSNQKMVVYYSHASRESKREAMRKLYDDSNSELERLREIYEMVKSGALAFEDFAREFMPHNSPR